MSDQGHDPTDIPGQERAKAKAAEQDRQARDTEEADLKWLMGSKRGRRIVWRQLERARIFQSSWNTNSMTMAFTEGTKNEGYYTLALIHKVCPELYTTMVEEHNDERRKRDGSNGHNDH